MAAEDLPSEFDVVILGTGLVESVVAAACSRVGQKVLHVDRRSYYAASWASFTFNGLLTWIQQQQEGSDPEEVKDWTSLLVEGEELIQLSHSEPASISNLQVFCYTSEEDEEDDAQRSDPIITEEEKTGDEDAVKETETVSAVSDSKDEEEDATADGDKEEQAVKTQGEESDTGQTQTSAAPVQSEPTRRKISYAHLVKEGRRFNIDLISKLMFSRGSLIDLLIKSNVSRYAEFKNVTRVLTYRHGNVEQVPCSRADVFASRQLSVVEKRKLMRFLTSCMEEAEEHQAYSGRPYLEFLRDQQLGDNLEHFLLHSIAMVTENTPTEDGLASTRHFLRSLGRYGNTPFLFPVYGLGEIPQCFCRMSAVFGGIYCLRHSVHCLIVDKDSNRCKAVIDSRGQRISCGHFVVEDGYVAKERKKVATPTRFLSRAVLITDSSILAGDSEQQVSVVTIPPEEAGHPAVKMVELCSSTMTCIPGTYLLHLTCQSSGSAHDDLSPLVTRMFNTGESAHRGSEEQLTARPSVLWCLYFNMVDGSSLVAEGHRLPSNVHLCSGPDGSLSHEHAVKQAESIFQKILPDEEFCPPAPNPEDIIYDAENLDSSTADEEREEQSPQKADVEGRGLQAEDAEGRGLQAEDTEGRGLQAEDAEGRGLQAEDAEGRGLQAEDAEGRGLQAEE
ncbi:rab proteins geranylgeranyltransferase component A 1 [Cololabis saira]|uniref:rab proteins geranylgeranyltransferase component A 1 n=1 Tax=Cololabis saira TaxID=129043 RepID=UPI002AD34851|nr:rab proteins geranylgeranyltransferase component A 1 [Cololabis saira]